MIVSDWPLLRESFALGALHVNNSADSIVTGVRQMQMELPRLKEEVLILRDRKREQWNRRQGELMARLTNRLSPSTRSRRMPDETF